MDEKANKQNFVAEGIVVHNSQESLRYVRLTDINMFFPKIFSEFGEEKEK